MGDIVDIIHINIPMTLTKNSIIVRKIDEYWSCGIV